MAATAVSTQRVCEATSVRVHLLEEDLVPGARVVGEVDAELGVRARPTTLAFVLGAQVPRKRHQRQEVVGHVPMHHLQNAETTVQRLDQRRGAARVLDQRGHRGGHFLHVRTRSTQPRTAASKTLELQGE